MFDYTGTVNEVYPMLARDMESFGSKVDSRVAPTLELHPTAITLIQPGQRLLTSYGRIINVPFALAEVVWILLGRSDVDFLKRFNSKIGDIASDDGNYFNAAYGNRLRSAHGHDQLADVIQLLRRDPGTRQATLTIWHPDDRAHEIVDLEVPTDEWVPRQTKDRACNLLAHLLIRDGRLDWMQIMRSNDMIWGFPYNVMQWTYLQEHVARSVGVEMGRYLHVADSFHIYDYHQDDLPEIKKFSLYNHFHRGHAPFRTTQRDLLLAQVAATQGWDAFLHNDDFTGASEWVYEFAQIWRAWDFYKAGQDRDALAALMTARDPIYATATVRFFWTNRWHKGDEGHPTPAFLAQLWEQELVDWITAS